MKTKGIYSAIYDYEAQTHDELNIKQGDILIIIDDSDQDWWLANLKNVDMFEENHLGVVPKTYIEILNPIATAFALYDYEAQTPEEISIKEGETFQVYDQSDPDWWWGTINDDAGLVPATYVEIPDSNQELDMQTNLEQFQIQENHEISESIYAVNDGAIQKNKLLNALDGFGFSNPKKQTSDPKIAFYDLELFLVSEIENKKKKRLGLLGIDSDFMIIFLNEKTRELYYRIDLVTAGFYEKKSKKFFIQTKDELKEYESGRSEIQGLITLFNQKRIAVNKLKEKSVIISNQPNTSSNHIEQPPQISLKTSPKIAIALYDYVAVGEGELSILENENLLVLDDSDNDWWSVRSMKKNGGEGFVPKDYIQIKSKKLDGNQVELPYTLSSTQKNLSNQDTIKNDSYNLTSVDENLNSQKLNQWNQLEEERLRWQKSALENEKTVEQFNIETVRQKPASPTNAVFSPNNQISDPLKVIIPVSPHQNINYDLSPIIPQRPQLNSNLPSSEIQEILSPKIPIRTVEPSQIVLEKKPDYADVQPFKMPSIPSRPTVVNPEIPSRPSVVNPEIPTRPAIVNPEIPSRPTVVNPENPSRPDAVNPAIPSRPAVFNPAIPSRPNDPNLSTSRLNGPTIPSRPTQNDTKPVEKTFPNMEAVRSWTDKTQSFTVTAEYINIIDKKVHLHSITGAKIAVPLEKLSQKDIEYISSLSGNENVLSDVNSNISSTRKPLKMSKVDDAVIAQAAAVLPAESFEIFSYNGFDWKEFFINSGISQGDSINYAKKFVVEKLDKSNLLDLSRELLRSMGVSEGDIIRIRKSSADLAMPTLSKNVQMTLDKKEKEAHDKNLDMISNKFRASGASEDQIRKDEMYARKLQMQELDIQNSMRNNAPRVPSRRSSSNNAAPVSFETIQQASTILEANHGTSVIRKTSGVSNQPGFTALPSTNEAISARLGLKVDINNSIKNDPWNISTTSQNPTALPNFSTTKASFQDSTSITPVAKEAISQAQWQQQEAQAALEKAKLDLMKAHEQNKQAAMIQEQNKRAKDQAAQAAAALMQAQETARQAAAVQLQAERALRAAQAGNTSNSIPISPSQNLTSFNNYQPPLGMSQAYNPQPSSVMAPTFSSQSFFNSSTPPQQIVRPLAAPLIPVNTFRPQTFVPVGGSQPQSIPFNNNQNIMPPHNYIQNPQMQPIVFQQNAPVQTNSLNGYQDPYAAFRNLDSTETSIFQTAANNGPQRNSIHGNNSNQMGNIQQFQGNYQNFANMNQNPMNMNPTQNFLNQAQIPNNIDHQTGNLRQNNGNYPQYYGNQK